MTHWVKFHKMFGESIVSVPNFITGYKDISSDSVTVALPISPIMDMITGEPVVGVDGVTYNNGGLCPNNAITGGNNTQKTGTLVLDEARVLTRFSTSIVFKVDQEGTFQVSRLAATVDRIMGIPGYFYAEIFDKRFFYFNVKDGMDGTWLHNFVKDYKAKIELAIKNKEDIYITTPFLDKMNKPVKIINPACLFVDGISEMSFLKVADHFQDGDVDSGGEKRTRDMALGNMKRIVYEDLHLLGMGCGLYQIWTAQMVNTGPNLSGRPEEKETVFIRQGKKLKAPRSMMRLPQVGFEIIRGAALKSDQEWMYPDPFGKDVFVSADAKENPDLLSYMYSIFRNKNNSSGGEYFFIGSQALGIQEGLTMYHVMKTSNMFGLDGSKLSQWSIFYPECKVGRTTIRKKLLDDPKLERALIIGYQMWFMQTFYLGMEHKYRISPQEVYDKIKARGIDWNDILENTVDFWFVNPDLKKHTVSTMELLKIALGERDPYWIKK